MENIKVSDDAKHDDIIIVGVKRIRVNGPDGGLLSVSYTHEKEVAININEGYLEITI